MKKYSKGFTLIELLVVIAIIGILASVVLVSLNSARNKGKDARVISDTQQIRTALESGYNGSNYPDLGNNATSSSGSQIATINQLTNDLYSQGSNIIIYTDGATATKYTILGRLTTDSTKSFCISSNGSTSQSTTTANVTSVTQGC